jgi:hypothetical protein
MVFLLGEVVLMCYGNNLDEIYSIVYHRQIFHSENIRYDVAHEETKLGRAKDNNHQNSWIHII